MGAVPALITAGGSLVSSLIGGKARKSAQKAAMQRTPEELAMMQSLTGLANQNQRQGAQMYASGMPAIQSTMDYYRTLVDGSRAARLNAVSGEAQDVAESYAGADVAADRKLTGGEREQAKAENARGRAGQIARLVTGVRPNAAAALASEGSGLIGASQQANNSAANIEGGLLENETNNRQQANAAGEEAGKRTSSNLGSLFGSIAGAAGAFGGGGGGIEKLSPPISTTNASGGWTPQTGNRGGPALSY